MFQIGGNEKFAKVIEFLRCQIHQDTVFLYVNSVFSPNPDELINDLYSGRSNALITFMFPAILSWPSTTTYLSVSKRSTEIVCLQSSQSVLVPLILKQRQEFRIGGSICVVKQTNLAHAPYLLSEQLKCDMRLKVVKHFTFLTSQNFGIDGQLVVNYASSMAWGWKVY